MPLFAAHAKLDTGDTLANELCSMLENKEISAFQTKNPIFRSNTYTERKIAAKRSLLSLPLTTKIFFPSTCKPQNFVELLTTNRLQLLFALLSASHAKEV